MRPQIPTFQSVKDQLESVKPYLQEFEATFNKTYPVVDDNSSFLTRALHNLTPQLSSALDMLNEIFQLPLNPSQNTTKADGLNQKMSQAAESLGQFLHMQADDPLLEQTHLIRGSTSNLATHAVNILNELKSVANKFLLHAKTWARVTSEAKSHLTPTPPPPQPSLRL